MKPPDFSEFDFNGHYDAPRLLEDLVEKTETIDLDRLFSRDVTSSGSFNIRGVQKTSLGRLLDALPIPALLLDRSQAIFFCNQASDKLCADTDRLLAAPFAQILGDEPDYEAIRPLLSQVYDERRPQVVEGNVGTVNRGIWARMHMRSLRLAEERFVLVLIEDLTAEKKYAQSLQKDRDELELKVRERTAALTKANEELREEITERMRAQESLHLASRVMASSNEAIMVTDSNGRVVEANDAFCQITGFSREEVLGQNPRIMASGRHGKEFWQAFWLELVANGQWKGEVWDRRKNGEVYPKLLSVSAVKDKRGNVTHYVGIFSDITRIKKSEQRLAQLAHYDPLTSLPNRSLFRERLTREMIRAARQKTSVAVMFLDLDSFKNVNDSFGHPLGDELLVAVSSRLTQCLRQGDTVARLGGDEFVLLMPDIANPQQVAPVAKRVIDAVSGPFFVGGIEIHTSASIGISIFPRDATEVDQLLQHADTAMYCAKGQGKHNFQFFSKEMNHSIRQLVAMETTLRRAIEHDQLRVFHQPVVHCRSGRVVGTEALLRLKPEGREPISAGPFIRVAEEKGLIVTIGEWVFRTACKQNRDFQDRGFPPMRVAVNLSMHQLRRRGIVNSVLQMLEETGHDPRDVELELTESAMMSDPDLAIDILGELRRNGLTISIDDFGTGYSSLGYLRRLPIDKIKIDKSFIDDIHSDAAQRALVEAIVKVAHALNMTVVAEGVESRTQLEVLRALDCDAWQGHLFSPAVSPEQLQTLLAQETA